LDALRRPAAWRQAALIVLFLGFSLLAVSQFTSASEFATAMISGVWYWGLVAVVLTAVFFYLYAWLYEIGYHAVGVSVTTRHMLPVMFSSLFLNTVVPLGGAAGAAIFIEDAREHDRPQAKTATGVILVLLVDLATVLPFIAVGLAFIASRHGLGIYDVVGSACFTIFLLILGTGLWFARHKRLLLEGVLRWIRRVANRVGRTLRRPELVSEQWPVRNAEQLSDAADSIARHPRAVAKLTAVAFISRVVSMLSLWALFATYRQDVSLGLVTAGFAMSVVFSVVAIIPQGIGAVEGVMALVFTAAGVPADVAVVVSISYRILNVWIPLVIGFFCVRRMSIFRSTGRPVRSVPGQAALPAQPAGEEAS
jgi:glycosyltransferase 2 family protein